MDQPKAALKQPESAHRQASFDPVRVGQRECDAWAAYYRHEWASFLRSAIGMVSAGFGMGRRQTLAGAWCVLQANRAWAPVPDNDPDAARDYMARFYRIVRDSGWGSLDPVTAAGYEVEWWRLHRLRGKGRTLPRWSMPSTFYIRMSMTSRRRRCATLLRCACRPWTCPTSGLQRAVISTIRC